MTEPLYMDFYNRSLDLERFKPPEPIEWLDQSWEKGSDFWPSLCRTHDSLLGTAMKSRPFKQYDFFHDLITRNLHRETPAFVWYDAVTLWQTISYKDLGQQAKHLSDSWKNSGMIPGQTLCIVMPFGLRYLVSLLAGVRTGAILSFIPPRGSARVKKMLESLEPDHICTENIYLPLLTGWTDRILDGAGTLKKTAPVDQSHTYMAGGIAARCFDPMCRDLFTPKAVSSDLLFLSGIRDALIGLGLSPGDIFAAPGFGRELSWPSFVISVLVSGATFLHLSIKDLEKNPDLLTRYPLKTLGINSKLRDILMDRPIRKVRIWESWFRDPTEDSNMHVWESFIQKLELTDIPVGCMVWNTAMGGGLLFSRRRRGQALQQVLPMPGRKWQMVMVEDEKTPAVGGIGLFSLAPGLENDGDVFFATPLILAQTHLEKVFLGMNLPARKGKVYPVAFITKIVQDIHGCSHAVMAVVPNIGTDPATKFHLLVFVDSKQKIDTAQVIARINQKILHEMGTDFYVDEIKLFPLFPRHGKNGQIDENWCCSQYLNGGLNAKSSDDLFLGLSGLRDHVFRH